MLIDESSYYAEISVLVDGWPWNLSEFDFRRWFAPGVADSLLESAETMSETVGREHVAAVSENRLVGEPTRERRGQRGPRGGAKERRQERRARRDAERSKHGRKVA